MRLKVTHQWWPLSSDTYEPIFLYFNSNEEVNAYMMGQIVDCMFLDSMQRKYYIEHDRKEDAFLIWRGENLVSKFTIEDIK